MSNPSSPKHWVIIPAAGVGSRMQMDIPKQYLQVDNKTILEHTLSCFLSHASFEDVYVGISSQDTLFNTHRLNCISGVEVFIGGSERSDTVLKGLAYISDKAKDDDWVWVHDAARPCLSNSDVDLLMQNLGSQTVGLVLGVPISDTIKRVSIDKHSQYKTQIIETVDRTALWRAMTPQIFKYSALRSALEFCRDKGLAITDESSAMELRGQYADMVRGSDNNIKVTLPADLIKVRDCLEKGKEYEKIAVESKINQ